MTTDTPNPDRAKQVTQGFALMLEAACKEFECLQHFLTGDLRIRSENQFIALRALGTIQLALAKAFLFNAARAYRICEHGKDVLALPRDLRKDFMQVLKPIVPVRDVNEHGFDAHEVRGKKNDRPRLHPHEGVSALVDETSMVIEGPERIMMGPLNLFDVYVTVAEMKAVAGFHTLP